MFQTNSKLFSLSSLSPLMAASLISTLPMIEASGSTSENINSAQENYFAVPAFFMLFRETLEAAVVVSILLQYLERSELPNLKKHVWCGVAVGFLLAAALGGGVIAAYHTIGKNYFTGKTEEIFEGFMMVLGAAFLTGLGFSMKKLMNNDLSNDSEVGEAVDKVVSGQNKRSLFLLAFMAVLREGIESIVFVGAVGTAYPLQSIPIPAVTGAMSASALGYFMHKGGNKLSLSYFHKAATAMLFLIAAGLLSHGLHEFQEVEWLGDYKDNKPWHNRPLWDMSECCSDKKNEFWQLMRAMFGYQDKPTPVEFLSYVGYWLLITATMLYKSGYCSSEKICSDSVDEQPRGQAVIAFGDIDRVIEQNQNEARELEEGAAR